ncbi:hypothetical protein [Actinomadura rayongensis]|uniref:Uncharacterized protein n=1 Tax=Actinomadura rayongensis TaxID=1429076 RepID=A0A6I4W4E9_9ACTN|nr:hypothetical protein [Actinomadura rayongensis]MXQ64318.1 hypothetical protein [Actinomadura rayongensis]
MDTQSISNAVDVIRVEPGGIAEEAKEFRRTLSCSWSSVDGQGEEIGLAGTGLQIKYDVLLGDGGTGGGHPLIFWKERQGA